LAGIVSPEPMADYPDNSKYHPRDFEPWKAKASRHLIRDQWLRVRADDCITPDGAEIAPFYVLEYPDWVQIVALDADDHIILVDQYRHGLGVMSLELPAGAVEQSDPSPLIAAARELEEETGFFTLEWQHIARLSPNPANHNNFCHVVLARDVYPRSAPVDDPAERVRVVRLPISEAVQLAMSGRMIQALHVASLALGLSAAGKWKP
jgi:8-oxo-dGDP phosphatase